MYIPFILTKYYNVKFTIKKIAIQTIKQKEVKLKLNENED